MRIYVRLAVAVVFWLWFFSGVLAPRPLDYQPAPSADIGYQNYLSVAAVVLLVMAIDYAAMAVSAWVRRGRD